MEQTFNAELHNNKIVWLDKMPAALDKKKKYHIKVQIDLEKEEVKTGEELIEFFRKSPLYGLNVDLSRDKETGREIEL